MNLRTTTCRNRALILIFLLLTQLAFSNVDPNKGRVTANPTKGNRYTIEQDIELGREVVPKVERQLKLLPADHPASKFVNALGQKLAAKAPGYKFPYTFKVVRESGINAFALPGGPVYVNVGTIQAANEAELAGVMGHEIAHVVMRHSTREASRKMKAQLPLAVLGGVLGATVGGAIGSLAQAGLSLSAGGVFMKYSRGAETEADKVGAQIIYDAGYNPQALVTFFEKLKAQRNGGDGGFLASHPDPGDRAKEISATLARFPPKQFNDADSPEFLAAKQALSDVKTLTPEQAQAEEEPPTIRPLSSDELAAHDYSTYEHRAFQLSYPSNWKLTGDRDSTITVSPEGGSAQGSVAYGVIASGFEPNGGNRNLDDAIRQLISDTRDTNPDLHATANPVNISVSKRPAKSVELTGKSSVVEDGQRIEERVRMVVVAGKGRSVLYLLFIAPEKDFDTLRPAFDHMLLNFKVK